MKDIVKILGKILEWLAAQSATTKTVIALALPVCFCCTYALWYSDYRQAPAISGELLQWQSADTANWGRQFRHNRQVAEWIARHDAATAVQTQAIERNAQHIERLAHIVASGNKTVAEMLPHINEVSDKTSVMLNIMESLSRPAHQPSIEVQKKKTSWDYMFNPFNFTAYGNTHVYGKHGSDGNAQGYSGD